MSTNSDTAIFVPDEKFIVAVLFTMYPSAIPYNGTEQARATKAESLKLILDQLEAAGYGLKTEAQIVDCMKNIKKTACSFMTKKKKQLAAAAAARDNDVSTDSPEKSIEQLEKELKEMKIAMVGKEKVIIRKWAEQRCQELHGNLQLGTSTAKAPIDDEKQTKKSTKNLPDSGAGPSNRQ